MSLPSDWQLLVLCVLLYFVAVIALIYVLLCGTARRHEGTFIASAHYCLTIKCPSFLERRVLTPVCGTTARARRTMSYVTTSFEKYVMPVLYFVILLSGLFISHRIIIPRLPELERHFGVTQSSFTVCPPSTFFCHNATGIAFPPRVDARIIPFYLITAIVSWLAVFLTDPGTLSSTSFPSLSTLYPPDNLMFDASAAPCRTCLRPKPARSKHCALCNRCVARFDHHCGWLATCIGLYNTRFFHLFLAVHATMLAHATLVCWQIVRNTVRRLIFGGYIIRATGRPISRFTLSVAFRAESTLFAATIAFGASFVFVAGFFMYHVVLVTKNVTTNETEKLAAVRAVAEDYLTKNGSSIWGAMREEAAEDDRIARAAMTGKASQFTSARKELPAFDDNGEPVIIYNHGLLRNIDEVLRPHQFVRFAAAKRRLGDDDSR